VSGDSLLTRTLKGTYLARRSFLTWSAALGAGVIIYSGIADDMPQGLSSSVPSSRFAAFAA
jgi:hypothetical protein